MRLPFWDAGVCFRGGCALAVGLIAAGLATPPLPVTAAQAGIPSARTRAVAAATIGVWEKTRPMNVARLDHTATRLPDGTVLVTGGEGRRSQWLRSAEIYVPGKKRWTVTAPMHRARSEHHAYRLADGDVVVFGGCCDDNGIRRKSTETFHSDTHRWSPAGRMIFERSGEATSQLADGRILVVGGTDADDRARRGAEIYDPISRTWSRTTSMHFARARHTATTLRDGRVLVVGGCCSRTGSQRESAELYDPVTETWTMAPRLSTGRSWHSAVLLTNGDVLISGGTNGSDTSDSGYQRFQPTTNTWSPDNFRGSWLVDTRAVRLHTGRVLVIGGFYQSDYHYWFAHFGDLYLDTPDRWENTPQMTARADHTATLLGGGRVLVAGGFNSRGVRSDALLYRE
jgi:hypothetical protein